MTVYKCFLIMFSPSSLWRKTINSREMPENQRATSVQAGSLALALSMVALEFFPGLHYATWEKLCGSFGYYAKKERLQLYDLGERHADYVVKPLLWSYAVVLHRRDRLDRCLSGPERGMQWSENVA